MASMFGTNDPAGFYFRISRSAGGPGDHEIARSDNYRHPAADEPNLDHYFDRENHGERRPDQPPNHPPPLTFQGNRMAAELMPSGELIEVGCSVAPELRELKITALTLAGIGGGILLLGLAGGWWFVGRALRPISAISATATKIAAGDLSQRIDTAEAESELGQLAAVLNSTFARLEMAFAQQKQFASDAAHELRTPVAIMLTQTQTALSREREAAGYKQTVEACQRAAQRMRRLIESLLELTRFDAGQEVLKRMKFDLAATVADSVEMVQTLAQEKRVKIIPALTPLEITGDPERLAQVMVNLLTNAIQVNGTDGEVRANLEARDGLAVLEISNTGKGIAPEDLPHVFERFYRADKSRTGAGNSGLGLSICKAIVEAHGGTVEAASVPNTGATFIVRLPI
jgi:heavy metal sensor kinase